MSASIDFDGTDDIVTVSDDNSLTFGDGTLNSDNCMIEFWFNADDKTGRGILAKEDEYECHLDGTYLYLRFIDNSSGSQIGSRHPVANLTEGKWHHFAMTKTSKWASSLYVDGSTTGSSASNVDVGNYVAMENLANDLILGYNAETSTYYDGKLTEVRLWDKALDAADILIHAGDLTDITCANTASCSYASNCVAHWKCDEGTGTSLADSSANTNTGTFKGAGEPVWSTDFPSFGTSMFGDEGLIA